MNLKEYKPIFVFLAILNQNLAMFKKNPNHNSITIFVDQLFFYSIPEFIYI